MKNDTTTDSVEILGYTIWATLDVISAGLGEMSKIYGFIYINQDNYGNGPKKELKRKVYIGLKKL